MPTSSEDRGRDFRREHPLFYRGALALALLFAVAALVVGIRVPRYWSETQDLNRRMTDVQRATRDSVLASRQRRTLLALAVLRRDMRIRSYENRKRHLAISLQDSVLELRHGAATLRRARVQVGGDSVVRMPGGRVVRLVRPLGERRIAELQRSPTYTVPEWVYAARGEAPPPEAQRRVPGALGEYVIRLDDGTEIYSKPSAGPFAEGVKPASFQARARDLAAIFDAVGEDTPVYIY